jgi:ribosomal protein S18 acetylase RimI-like enzyme
LEIRSFNGTLHDAEGILKVDEGTFGDCYYAAEHILALEADPRQRAWVAEEDGQIVGFVSAFDTHSLDGSRWEIDELAVLPAWQGRGIGTL